MKARALRRGWLLALALLVGCGGGVSRYLHPAVDLSYVRRAAVLPFENLSSDGSADEKVGSLFLMQLLGQGGLELVEPGEVLAGMGALGLPPGRPLTSEQYVQLGRKLEAQALFLGSVEDYGAVRSSREQISEITATFGLVETETGILVWQAQVHRDNGSIWRRIFGGSGKSLHEISRDAVEKALGTLY